MEELVEPVLTLHCVGEGDPSTRYLALGPVSLTGAAVGGGAGAAKVRCSIHRLFGSLVIFVRYGRLWDRTRLLASNQRTCTRIAVHFRGRAYSLTNATVVPSPDLNSLTNAAVVPSPDLNSLTMPLLYHHPT